MTHKSAVERAIKAANLDDTDAALVELLRTLARQVDAAGPEGPGTRLSASYLTALRTLAQRAKETDSHVKASAPAAAGGLTTTQRRARARQRGELAHLDEHRGA